MTENYVTKGPGLSVLITTYNRPHLLSRAVQSVLQQTFDRYEVVILDDGSSPPVAQFEDHRIRVIYHEKNQGIGTARNTGLRAARYGWVVLLDDDDTLRPKALETIADELRRGDWDTYPMIQFRRSGATLDGDRRLLRPDDYFSGRITGEYCLVFQPAVFLPQYDFGVGNTLDSVYIWRIARDVGIPTFGPIVQDLHVDASDRFSGWRASLRRADLQSSSLSLLLDEFGEKMRSSAPWYYRKTVLRAVVYAVLARKRQIARALVRDARLSSKWHAVAWSMAHAPEALLIALLISQKLKWRADYGRSITSKR